MIGGAGALGLALGLAMTGAPAMATPSVTLLNFDDLTGWAEDDHAEALAVFVGTCGDLRDREWASLCAFAATSPDPRGFFEHLFRPVVVSTGSEALFTGYFEPELAGALEQSDAYPVPLYGLPPEVTPGTPWLTRREIEEGEVLQGRGLELAWVADPIDAYFLQIQGSGRIRLVDGSVIRLGYAGGNGQPYSSIGQELIDLGLFEPHEVSAEVIRTWVRDNPEDGAELMRSNASFVFFRRIEGLDATTGPLGAMNRPLTAMRSLAVDPTFVSLGAPVWIESQGAAPLARLMVAQDTGAAVKGAQRGDIFFGTGGRAGRAAGRVRDAGRMVLLLPIQLAAALAEAPDPASPASDIR